MLLSIPGSRSPAAWLPAVLLVAALASAQEPPPSIPDQPAAAPRAPLPPPGEMARCKELIDAGLYGAARARLAPIVEQHPGWARALSLLALSYYRENRFEAARPLFARALEADPEEIAARPLYGWTLYSLGELDAAAAMFESLLERKPDYAPAHYALGMIALDRDDTGDARRRFEATIRLAAAQADPTMEGRARARLGDLHAREGDLPGAKAELERAIALFPGDAEALFRLSRVLQQMGDEGGAARARERYEAAKAPEPRRAEP